MSHTDWKQIKLKNICDEITVGHVGPMASEYVDSGIPFFRSQNIKPFYLDFSDIKFVTPEFHKKLKKSALHPGDVVVVRTGYPGVATVIPKTLEESNCSDLVIIRKSPNIDSFFLVCIFNSQWGQSTVSGNLVGAAQQHFNIGAAKEVKINIPPLPTQQKIASILSAYNNLIQNNTRRIKILEEMAQIIYQEWFVNFRFPGHENVRMVESELGPVPEGWKVKTVEETFEISGGGTPSTKVPEFWESGTINWYSPVDLTATGTMFMDCSGNQINELGLKKSSAKIFPPYSVMMTSRATLGVISINTTDACTNQGFITCIPNEQFPLYTLYHWLKENVEMFISLGTGSTFKEITKGVFKTIQLVVPTPDVISQFEKTMQPLALQILNLQRKNANLRRTRDLLLPKLISGELDVSILDIRIPEAEA